MSNARARIVAAVAVAAIVAVAAAILVGGGSGDGAGEPSRTVRSQLTLERSVLPTTGRPEELVVSLPDQRLNVPETTRGATSVLLRCVDGAGAERLRERTAWPLLEEPGYPPHIHQPIRPDVLDAVRGCRLTGPGIDFAGRVPGRVPNAPQ